MFLLFIQTIKISKKLIIFITILAFITTSVIVFYSLANDGSNSTEIKEEDKKDFIKWVDFNITADLLNKTAKLDIDSHNKNSDIQYNWIELLAYLACKNGGNFKNFKQNDLDKLLEELKKGKTIEELTKDNKYYSYYYESYSAALDGFIGNYTIKTKTEPKTEMETKLNSSSNSDLNSNLELAESNTEAENKTKITEEKYGLKAFLPIAKNYGFSHYDDFGNSRSYGFKRIHLGNDLMGSIGTPIIAVEGGTIEHLGWNQYGGWRIGIRSENKKRYYYYAHLRKDHPYAEGLKEGDTVEAGDVIGYLGMTGYSTKENVNNINVPHLHFGMQLIFDESQVDSNNEIWIDVYQIIEFLKKNRSEVYMSNKETKDYSRK